MAFAGGTPNLPRLRSASGRRALASARRGSLALAVLTVASAIVGACSSHEVASPRLDAGGDAPAPAKFSVTVTPAATLLSPGTVARVAIPIVREPDFAGAIRIVISGLPQGVAAAPIDVAEEDSTATLTLEAAALAPGGMTANATVEAVSGSMVARAPLEVTTTGPAPELDGTFGEGGRMRIGAAVSGDQFAAACVLPDGKLVLAGSYRTGYTTVPVVARFLATGVPDATFGEGGVVLLASHDSSSAIGVLAQPDGKIVVLEANDFTLTRLDTTGTPDPTFNGSGTTSAQFPTDAAGVALAIQPDGKIVVVGGTVLASADFAVARFSPDGTLDPGFGTAGRVTTAVALEDDGATALALETNLATTVSIVVGGNAAIAGGRQAAVVRYRGADGALDPSFDGDGIATYSSGASRDDLVTGVALVAGKVVLSGHRRVAGSPGIFSVVRFSSVGGLDPTFGVGGAMTVALGGDASASGLAISGSKIVVAGEVLVGGTSQSVLARIDDTGTLDPGFGTSGTVVSPGPSGSSARAIVRQPDGALVVVGTTAAGADVDGFVARYSESGVPDPTFDGDGRVTIHFGPADEEVRALAVQENGSIVAAGAAFNGRDFDLLVARVLPSGTLDPSFGGGRGYVLYDRGASEFAYDVRLQPDGKIVVAGEGGPGALVVRLDSGGALDATFGEGGVAAIPGGDGFGVALAGPDGKIVVGGPSPDGDFFLARLTSAGVLDSKVGGTVGFERSGSITTDFGFADRAVTLALDDRGKVVLVGHSDRGAPPNFFDLSVARYEPSGALDPTFDGDGKMMFDTASVELLYAAAIQRDHKILIGGRMQRPGRATSLGVFRIAENGAVDTTFGVGGRAATELADGSQASAIVVEPSGMILVAGRSADDRIALVRLSPSGAPIWPSGVTTATFGSRSEGFALALQPDGRAVVAGTGHGRLEDEAVILRYLR